MATSEGRYSHGWRDRRFHGLVRGARARRGGDRRRRRDRDHDRAPGPEDRRAGARVRGGRRRGARADRRARRRGAHQRLGRADPALGARAAKGGGGQMTLTIATSAHTLWWIALAIGLVAALVVAFLLAVLIRTVTDIDKSVGGLLEVAGKVAGNTANIPQLEATAPVLGLIVEEAVVQDGYMSALTDGYGDAP